MDGLLLVDKPVGPTSHDIVARVRRVLGERSVGHTGTLDPLASGLLALVLGRATRLARFLSAGDKHYEAEIRLGIATDTYDAQGTPTTAAAGRPLPSRDEVDRALDAYRGTFLQQPPAYSAKKIGGQRSYKLARHARAHSTFPDAAALPAPVSVTAHAIDLRVYGGDRIELDVGCSAGFYIRSLAHDLGQRLGVGAHLTALRRTRSGRLSIAQAVTMEALERAVAAGAPSVIPLSGMLTELAPVVLTPEGAERAAHGRTVGPQEILTGPLPAEEPPPHVRLLDQAGNLVGIAEPVARTGLLHPSIVLR